MILADGGTPSLRFELQYLLCGAMQASPPAFSFTMSPVIRQGFFYGNNCKNCTMGPFFVCATLQKCFY